MDHIVLYGNSFGLILIYYIKIHPWKVQHTGWGGMVFTKASAPQPFPRRDVASARLPWLLAVGSCCSRCSLFSAAMSDQAIGPSTPGLCLLVFELIHTTPALSSVTSTKCMQRRWISPVFPILSPGICLCLRALTLQWELNMRSCATTVLLLTES